MVTSKCNAPLGESNLKLIVNAKEKNRTFQTEDFIVCQFKAKKRGKTTEEFIASVTCRLHRSETCARWKEGKSKIHLLFASSRLNFMPQTHTIRLRSKSIQNDFALLFLWMPSIGYLLCVFTTHTKRRRWWWRNLTFFVLLKAVLFSVFSKSIKMLEPISFFSAVFLLCILIILHFIFIVLVSCQQVTNHHRNALKCWFRLCKWNTHNCNVQSLWLSSSITKELTIVKNYRLAMQPDSTRKIQI